MATEWHSVVFAWLPREARAVPAGRLVIEEEGSRVVGSRFGYGKRYCERKAAFDIDPASLPRRALGPGNEAVPAGTLAFFGAIRDAAPDLWGRRVIENKLRVLPGSLPESAYLEHAGSNRFGALDFRSTPEAEEKHGMLPDMLALDYLMQAVERVEAGDAMPANLEFFFDAGPSMGGARPKAVVLHEGRQWIAKFPSRGDGFNMPLIEFATLELARKAGLDVPATHLVSLADGRKVLLVERFDREAQGDRISRRHAVSALTLLGLDEAQSSTAAYSDLSIALGEYGVSGQVAADREELFGRMVFNILVSNDDDHLRNHAFVSVPDSSGWRLSPLYDVVPKPQVASERFLHLSVGEDGRLATLDNAFGAAGLFGLHDRAAAGIIDRIAGVVREWRTGFREFGVGDDEADKVASAFRRPRDIGLTKIPI